MFYSVKFPMFYPVCVMHNVLPGVLHCALSCVLHYVLSCVLPYVYCICVFHLGSIWKTI